MKNDKLSAPDWGGQLKLWINDNTRPLSGLAVTEKEGKIVLLYQPKNSNTHTLTLAESEDGFNFSAIKHKGKIFCSHGEPEEAHTIKNARISKIDDKYVAFFQRHQDETTYSATSSGAINWRECREQIHLANPGIIAEGIKTAEGSLMYVGGDSIYAAYSQDNTKWVQKEISTVSRESNITYGIELVIVTEAGIQVYFHKKETIGRENYFSVSLVVFDPQHPDAIIWRPQEPFWEQPSNWQGLLKPFGAVQLGHKLIGYWQVGDTGIYATIYTLFEPDFRFTTRKISAKLTRLKNNPILSPNPENHWEAFNTFNPAAIYLEDKVHLIYRAQGHDYISVLGYATSSDGIHIEERLTEPIFLSEEPIEAGSAKKKVVSYQYVSGGGFGGCEDPRLTRIGDRIYMTYVSFDGFNPPRVALTSIAVSDFINRRFLWEKPVLISPPGVVDKNAVIFPEKVKGKYVIAHRIYPNILIDFVDSLEFDGTTWLPGDNIIAPRKDKWDSKKIGAGAPPIKTEDGWLLIYQAVGYQDSSKYKIGAMLLDLTDPTKVLHRSLHPILEPEATYENEGFKAGVVYPCGAVEIDETLFVYYGAADSYVCVATANMKAFLSELKHFEMPVLAPAVIRKIM